jgi:hypothetical protein
MASLSSASSFCACALAKSSRLLGRDVVLDSDAPTIAVRNSNTSSATGGASSRAPGVGDAPGAGAALDAGAPLGPAAPLDDGEPLGEEVAVEGVDPVVAAGVAAGASFAGVAGSRAGGSAARTGPIEPRRATSAATGGKRRRPRGK